MSNEPSIERRKEKRHPICMDIKVIAPKTSFPAFATNISGGGLEISTPTGINPQTKLMIFLQLEEEFVFHGTVIWALGDFVNKKWIYRAGIRTDTIAFKNRQANTAAEKAEVIKKILPQIRDREAGMNELKKMFA
ncbi:hypothetical protein PITCH_A1920027 [uncultured Desulfobacterium sp.]|uniref:PilZ domain-containing protein n=1 Tax=uncultured Desulfobacterium sp. TaxID=201089 RepID=A0A445MW47_9BACT|nr:hypothetical protein PITCH_A1920027 [uncultured Desulfobacterium sp.]